MLPVGYVLALTVRHDTAHHGMLRYGDAGRFERREVRAPIWRERAEQPTRQKAQRGKETSVNDGREGRKGAMARRRSGTSARVRGRRGARERGARPEDSCVTRSTVDAIG